MDKLVIENKIESLRKCLVRVEQRRPASAVDLLNDIDAQDILVLNLSRAVQLCVDIAMHILAEREEAVPSTMGRTFIELSKSGLIDEPLAEKMCNAVGFRNIAVHNYGDIDWAIVYDISHHKIEDFKKFVEQILTNPP